MQPQDVDSALRSVTVYARGAVCTRAARIEPAGGAIPRVVRVAGLPLSLRSGSLRARVAAGPSGLRVHDVKQTFQVQLAREVDRDAELRALEQSEDRVAQLEREQALLQREIQAVGALRPKAPKPKEGDPPRPAQVEPMLQLARFVDEELGRLHRRTRELADLLLDARNELELHRRRLQEASTARPTEEARLSRAALVSFDGPSGQTSASAVELEVEYFVPGARWYPAYDLRLDRTLGGGQLWMRALVAQRTGEDWSAVLLRLSTADLDRRAEVPELRSLRIGRSQPPPPRHGWREPPPGLDELFADHDAAMSRKAPRPLPGPVGAATTAEGAAATTRPMKPAAPARAVAMQASTIPPPVPPLAPEPPTPVADATMLRREMAEMDAPAAAPPVRMRAGLFGGLGRGGGGPPRRPAPKQAAPRDMEDEAELAEEMAGTEEVDLPVGEPEPAGIEPLDQLLDYDRLFLPGPGFNGRGKLRPYDEVRRDLLLVLGASVDISIHVQAVAAVLVRHQQQSDLTGLGTPPQTLPPRTSAGSYDYRYDAESPVDVPSDGGFHSVPVAAAEVALTPTYVAVPAVDPKVYRTLSIANRSPHALLAGPMDVTIGDEFAMTVPLPTVPPSGSERAGLGVEEAVQVARNTRFKETTGGLLGGAALLQHEVEIEVKNHLPHPAPLEVRERVPISSHEQIKVEEGTVRPPWKPDPAPPPGVPTAAAAGARSWRLTLGAGEKAQLSAQYTVRIPGDQMLVGGNRRV